MHTFQPNLPAGELEKRMYCHEGDRRSIGQGRQALLHAGFLFDDIRLQRLAVSEPCRKDYKKQEDEIVQHLVKLAFPLPASVPNPIFILGPSHQWWTEIPGASLGILTKQRGQVPAEVLESDEESGMDTTVPDSTDTAMYLVTE